MFFSDVEGSTRLAKAHGDAAWAELLETHQMSEGQASASVAVAMAVRAMNRVFQMSTRGADPALVAEARREAAAAYDMACSAPFSQGRMHNELLCAWMETALGDLSAAVRWWGAVITSSESLEDAPWMLSVALAGLAATLHVMGRHDDALRTASRFMVLPSLRDTMLAMTSILAGEVAPVLVAGAQHGSPTDCCATPCAMHGALAS